MTTTSVPRAESSTARERASALQRNAWFAALGPALKQEIVRRSVTRRYAARSLVYAAGAPPSGCFFVLGGEVRLEHVTARGKYAFYQSLRSGEVFGMLSEIDASPRFSDARAWVASTLLHLPHAECQDLYRHDAEAREAFVALLCRQMHTTLALLVEAHSLPPRRQVAQILVTLFDSSSEAGGGAAGAAAASSSSGAERGDLPRLTQEAIAAMAGLSRPTVAKVLHELSAEGLIELQYGRVRLLQVRQLRGLGEEEG